MWVQMFPKSSQLEFLCGVVGAIVIVVLGSEDDHVLKLVQYPYARMDWWSCVNNLFIIAKPLDHRGSIIMIFVLDTPTTLRGGGE
jgi:hypothetical protein